jgi:hypothetical protein
MFAREGARGVLPTDVVGSKQDLRNKEAFVVHVQDLICLQ